MMKKYLIITLLLLMQGFARATPQASDFMKWNDTTYHVYPSIIKQDAKFQNLTALVDSLYGLSTANWKGYVCTYEIDKDTLYLIGVKDRFGNDYMSFLFSTEEKKMMSSVSDTLYLGYGKAIYDPDLSFMVFENETTIVIENGVLKSWRYNKGKTKTTKYGSEMDVLKYVYSQIEWNMIDQDILEKKPKVIIQFNADSLAMIDSVRVLRSSGYELLDKESIRVVKSLPGFRVSFFQGKYYYPKYNISIVFDLEKRAKYKLRE